MEVIMLAGGMGTRLRNVISNIPKPMAPIGDKPFLEFLLQWLAGYRVSSVILSTGYKAEVISDYFGDNFNNMSLLYAHEEEPLGTGGAILNAMKLSVENDVVIINADTYFPINLDDLSHFHNSAQTNISVALKPMNNFDRYGTVNLDGDTIVSFNEKQYCDEGLINGGIYMVNKKFLFGKKLPLKFSFEKEVLEKEAGTSNLKGVIYTAPFIDIGIPEDYSKAIELLK
ncbi:MAG: nucleotidyltransferase family protein [Mucilaginibacter sp.]